MLKKGTLSSTNTFRKKPLTRLVLKIIEFHLSSNQVTTPRLSLIMPKEYHEECNYKDINEDNVAKYANYIGNILLDLDIYNTQAFCIKERYENFRDKDTLAINDITQDIFIDGNKVSRKNTNSAYSDWGKDNIIKRSQMIAEVAKFLIIDDHLDKNFFS